MAVTKAFTMFSLSVSAVVSGHPQAVAATCNAGSASCKAGATVSLVQMHQDMDKVSGLLKSRASTASQVDSSQVAAHIRAFLAQPNNVAAAIAKGVMGLRSAMPFFTAEQPQLSKGLTILGTELFDAMAMTVSEETKNSQEFMDVQEAWDEVLLTLPSTAEDLAEGVQEFNEDGDIGAFVRVCNTVIKELGALTTRLMPEPVSAEVAKFISALEDAVEGFDEAMVAFTAGNATGAIQMIYAGIRSAASSLLPEDLQQDDTFSAVAGALDAVFGDLSGTVLKFQQQLLQSKVCWKRLISREHRRPQVCPSGTTFDGKHWCSTTSQSLLEGSVARKGSKPGSAPTCAEDSDYPTQKGSWCYKACPYGTAPFHTRCRSSCMGTYPVNSPVMCGKSPGTISAALMDTGRRAVSGILTLVGLVDGSGQQDLTSVAGSLVEAGKGFAHPQCPFLS